MKSTLQLFKVILCLISVIIISNKIYSQAGTLDLSFGDSGKVITQMHDAYLNAALQKEQIQKLLIQKNKKIVAAGFLFTEPPEDYDDHDIALARYNDDGTLDKTFGKKGKEILSKPNRSFYCADATLQPDDKILVAGNQAAPKNGKSYPILIRFTKDGSIDSSFGINGQTDTAGKLHSYLSNIVLLSDNSVIVAGVISNSSNDSSYTFLQKYSVDGAQDKSFGSNGQVILRRNQNYMYVFSLIAQPDNKILLSTETYGTIDSFYMFRFTSTGLYDESFGNNGKIVTGRYNVLNDDDSLNYRSTLTGVKKDNKIVVLGMKGYSIFTNFFLNQYNSDGSIDENFGTDGQVALHDSVYKTSLLVDSENRMVFGGETGNNIISSNEYVKFGISRYNSNGTIDNSFGTNGQTITDFGNYTRSICMSQEADGKIVQGGYLSLYTDSTNLDKFALSRYNNDIVLPVTLLSFTAKQENQSALLNWQTANEINNNYFSIERSKDSKLFAELGKLSGKGNSSQMQSYTFTDNKPFQGWNYYRLKQVDNDGRFSYSSVASVFFDNVNNISIYPNPAKNYLQIDGLKDGINSSLIITDANGKNVITTTASTSTYTLNIQNLASGVYYLTITQDGKTIKQKFIKQ